MSEELLPIQYEETLYRPPSEANSLILQATIGCSWNHCTFCEMYRHKKFRVRSLQDLEAEMNWAKATLPKVHKVFLADGDALVARASFLKDICAKAQSSFPHLRRISCYASPQALQARSVDEMATLREHGLSLYYLGLESGCDQTLEELDKGVDQEEMVRVAQKATDAGVKLSVMVLLGAAGPDPQRAQQHALKSAEAINRIQPRFVSTLVTTPAPNTPLMDRVEDGSWREPTPLESAQELRTFLAALDTQSVFRSNHASNWLAMAGTLPKDQEGLVAALDAFLAKES